jgi:hypothetical protein
MREIGKALKDPQGFIRLLSKLRAEDVAHGAEAWAAYYNTSWHERGLIVQTWRFLHVKSILDEMGQDHELAEAFRAAGTLTVGQLERDLPWAYERLVQAGFIHHGAYAIPDDFNYSPETIGTKMSERHWLDDLVNVKSITELVATVLLPAAGAGYLVEGLKAAEGASALARVGFFGTRVVTEAALFTIFSKGAKAVLHPLQVSGTEYNPEALTKEFLTNLVAIVGLAGLGMALKPLEKILLEEGAAARALLKPLGRGELGWQDLTAILKRGTFEAGKVGLEAVGMTALGGEHDARSFWTNVVFIAELRAAHLLTPEGRAELDRAARVRERALRQLPKAGRPGEAESKPPDTRQPGDDRVLSPGDRPRPNLPPEFSRWYRRALLGWGVIELPDLKRLLVREFRRIARDPATDAKTREAANAIRRVLRSNIVKVKFDDFGGSRGHYRVTTGRGAVHVGDIAWSLYDRHMKGTGRPPDPRAVLRAIMGTTVHEILVHGLQGLDARDPIKGRTRPYSWLHEIEARVTQWRFDKTLGGMYPEGATKTLAQARHWIIRHVFNTYTPAMVIGPRERALLKSDPAKADVVRKIAERADQYRQRGRTKKEKAAWQKAADAYQLDALRQLFYRRTIPAGSGHAVAPKAERLRWARLSPIERAIDTLTRPFRRSLVTIRDLFRAYFGAEQEEPKKSRKPARSAPSRRRGRGVIYEPGDSASSGDMNVPNYDLLRRFLDGLGTPHAEALRRRLVDAFVAIAGDETRVPEVRDAARTMSVLLESDRVKVRFDVREGTGRGGYDPTSRRATLHIELIAREVENMYRTRHGRSATADEFLTSLMGTAVHEAAIHGLQGFDAMRWREGVTRPYSRAMEVEAYMIQRLFDPTLGGTDLDGPTRSEEDARAFIVDLVQEKYPDRRVQGVNAGSLEVMDDWKLDAWERIRREVRQYVAEGGDRAQALELLKAELRDLFSTQILRGGSDEAVDAAIRRLRTLREQAPPVPRSEPPATGAPQWPDLFALLPDPARRHALLAEVARVAVGFDIARWRDAIRGNDEAEVSLLNLLRSGRIGEPGHSVTVAEELDARLRALPAPPAMDPQRLAIALQEAYEAWKADPGNIRLARRCIRLRTLAGGVEAETAASPVSDFPMVLSVPAGDGISAQEAVQLLVADGRSLATASPGYRALVAQVDRLRHAELAFGSLSPADKAGASSIQDLVRAIREQDWDRFWPAFLEHRRLVVGKLLREALS